MLNDRYSLTIVGAREWKYLRVDSTYGSDRVATGQRVTGRSRDILSNSKVGSDMGDLSSLMQNKEEKEERRGEERRGEERRGEERSGEERRGEEGRGEERRGDGDGLSEFKIRFVVMQ